MARPITRVPRAEIALTDPTLDILTECGAMAVAVYHVARANAAAGIPTTYATLEAQCGLKTRQMQYLCKILVEHGFLAVATAGGGRGNERRFAPAKGASDCTESPEKGAQKGAVGGAENCTISREMVQERVHKRVQSPPTPPVVVTSPVDGSITDEFPPLPPQGARRAPRSKPEPFLDGFEEFYDRYPKHMSRDRAEAAWHRLRPDAELRAAIMADVEARRQTWDWQKENWRYVPYPASYLNGRMWRDDLGASAPPAAPRSDRSSGGTVQRGDRDRYQNGGYLTTRGRDG